ncbi:MAG: YfhO family protein [Cyclobacteriaceae bacterium]|nr:YfhO family protein [Cyclobacteriaceae bacterium HetDA_MAG_MS6]
MNNYLKPILPHLWICLVFFVIASAFFFPLYSGKILVQSDNVQLTGVSKEISDYSKKGEYILWNNREFSGVPLQSPSNLNPFYNFYSFIYLGAIPKPILMVFSLCVGFYVLLTVFKVSRWLAAIGSFAFAFSTFNIISIEVGHDYKVLAMALMAPVLAGVVAAYRGEYFKGGVLTFLFAGFQLYFGHIQITYYLLLMVLSYVVTVIYSTSKSKNWKQFVTASSVLAMATLLALGCNFQKLYALTEYASYSTRGGSELQQKPGDDTKKGGLTKEYALSWSSGKMEAFTILFPYFHGGASGESLSEGSETFQTLSRRGVDRNTINNVVKNVPLYWGDQPSTGGPIYFGAVIGFFFILGLFILHGPIRWWAVLMTCLSLMLAMGKNLEWFTDIFYYHVPLYNKFRTVTMILAIAQLVVPLIAFITIEKILSDKRASQNVHKRVLQVGAGIVGLGVFFLIFKGSFFDFEGARDAAYGFPEWLINAIIADRKSLFNSDILRSILLVTIAATGIWLYVKNILKAKHLVVGIAVIILFDLWVVGKRYVGSEDFETKRRITEKIFEPSAADRQILADKDYFRVFNLSSQNPFSDGLTPYHHYSASGYSAIKMQRYQELIDEYLSKVNRNILNMLNIRYIITKDQSGPLVQRNTTALGNAWLARDINIVTTANDELTEVGEIDLSETVVINGAKFPEIDAADYSAEGTILLANYHPERMEYTFTGASNQFAVFSEVYYAPGWNAYIDGELTPHCQVNYVLRGLPVPKGEHKIEFKYEPVSREVGKYAIVGSLFIFLVLTVFGYLRWNQSAE